MNRRAFILGAAAALAPMPMPDLGYVAIRPEDFVPNAGCIQSDEWVKAIVAMINDSWRDIEHQMMIPQQHFPGEAT